MSVPDIHRTIDAVWRIESAKIIAALARMVRDVGVAEELAQDALVAALEHWPRDGVPDNPGAWLMHGRQAPRARPAAPAQAACEQAGRDRPRARGAARDGGGRTSPRRSTPRSTTTSATTCCAWSSPPATRCSRPRRAWRSRCACSAASPPTRSRAPSWCPSRPSRSASCAPSARWPRRACPSRCRARMSCGARLASVLEVIYLVFNEGYSATAGDDWMRPALCEEALRLGRILAELVPRRAGGARPGRADGDPGLALRPRASMPRASRSCCSTRTARAGTSC